MANTRKQKLSEQTQHSYTQQMVEDDESLDSQSEPEYTTWYNPKDFPAKLTLQTWSVSPRYIQMSPNAPFIPVGPGYNGTFRNITIPAGAKHKIESIYDQTIRKESNGMVVGGECPWLLKEDEVEVKMSEALDFELALQIDEIDKATKKLIKQNILTEKQAEYNAKKEQIKLAREQIKQDSNLNKK